jgi:hypothetical protein
VGSILPVDLDFGVDLNAFYDRVGLKFFHGTAAGAEQLGWAIRQSVPSAVEPDCLRNAVNTFFYRDPDTLPTTAPATSLSSGSHSFSRVFTGGFFEGLAGMLATTGTRDEAALLQVSQDIGAILVQGIRAASVVPTFFSQVAATMLGVAASRFSAQGYEAPLRSGFVRHGILPPSMAVAATHAPARLAAAAPSPRIEDATNAATFGRRVWPWRPFHRGLCRRRAEAA